MVEIRRVDTGEVVASLTHPRRVSAIAWGDGGRLLAAGTDEGAVDVWEVATSSRLMSLQGHSAAVTALLFHPAGKVLVSAGLDDTTRIWDLFRGRQLLAAPGLALGWRANGQQLAFRRGD